MTKAQKRVLGALKSLGSGWHSTTEVVRKLHPGKGSQRFNRSVYNTLFSLDTVNCKWEPETNAASYQWRVQ